MNKHLKDLIELSNFDKELNLFEPRIEKIREYLTISLNEEEKLNENVTCLESEINELKDKKKKNEIHLIELSEKLKSIAVKSNNVKTDKEAKALNLEEEIAKEQVGFTNDEIHKFDKVSQYKEDEIKRIKAELKQISKEIIELEKGVEDELKAMEEARKNIFLEKEKLVSDMDTKIITFYEKIKRWAGDTAVVPVKKQACYGCFITINDRIYNEIVKNEEIMNCEHCGRIVYKELVETEEVGE